MSEPMQHVGAMLPASSLELLTDECPEHGKRQVMARAGFAWYCPDCLDAKLRTERETGWAKERLTHLMACSEIPAKYRAKRFTATTPDQKFIRGTVAAFRDHIAKGPCWATLVLTGKPGTGKTLLACELSESLIANFGLSVRYSTAQGIVSEVQASYSTESKSEEGEILRFARYDVLVIDEIDAKRSSESANLILTEVINRRYNAEKPVVVITNQAIDNLAKFVGDRVADRLHENSFLCAFSGPSYRRST